MGLSKDLLSQFAKTTIGDKKTRKESTIYGTVKEFNNKLYVQLDGSDLLTPASTTADRKNGERVIVQIKDHTATIIGNITSPSASSGAVTNVTERIFAVEGEVSKFKSYDAEIANLQTNKLDAATAKITYATIESFDSINGKVTNLETKKLDTITANATYATIANLNAANAEINTLKTNKLDATTANANYANINFANINMTSVQNLFAKAGIIDNLVVNDTNITGELVGVTIRGDLILANTLVADRLIMQGKDGIYYKLNTDGIKVEASQTDYNSLNGSIITAKSITASKINVEDLVAFGATIGGFKLTENSIYSGVKTTVDNTTDGIYLDKEGQISFGNANNFVKYYKDQNGVYKLEISADSINLNSTSITATLTDLQDQINRINERL